MVDVQQLRATVAADEDEVGTSWADAPAVAASTVGMTNTSGRKVLACVVGGTVTVIKINDVTTGATAGPILLRPGAVLKITYSGAPTINWLYA